MSERNEDGVKQSRATVAGEPAVSLHQKHFVFLNDLCFEFTTLPLSPAEGGITGGRGGADPLYASVTGGKRWTRAKRRRVAHRTPPGI